MAATASICVAGGASSTATTSRPESSASRPPPRRSASAATRVTVAASSRARGREARDSSRGRTRGRDFLPRRARDAQEPVPKLAASVQDASSDDVRLGIPGRAARRTRRSASAEAFPMPGTSKRRGSSSSVRTPSGWVGVVEAHALGDETTTSALGRRSSRGALEKRHRGLDLGVILGEGHHHDVRAEHAQVFVLLVSLRSRERER